MNCPAVILKAWLALTPWWNDRNDTLEERITLYTPAAEVVCRATTNPLERAFLATQMYWEGSRLAHYVIEDRCQDGPKGARCDEGLATGLLQVHRWCRAAWPLRGQAATADTRQARLEAAARCVLQAARSGRRACGGLLGMFAFQSGLSCTMLPPYTKARIAMTYRILARLKDGPP
jgi:hypothetical protein